MMMITPTRMVRTACGCGFQLSATSTDAALRNWEDHIAHHLRDPESRGYGVRPVTVQDAVKGRKPSKKEATPWWNHR